MGDPLAALARLEGVPSAAAAATAAVDAVLRDRGLRVVGPEMAARARWQSARANADLTAEPDRWFAGALRAAAETASLGALIRVAPAQAFARAHALVARDTAGVEELGRVRDDAEVRQRMRGLSELLTTPTQAPAVVLAAVLHAEVVTVAPFSSGNDVLARALEHAVLVDAGLDPRAVVVVEAGHLAAGAAYGQLLAGYAGGGVSGVRDWLLHCARAVTHGAELSPLLGGGTPRGG